ncbi:MAG: hypothetical protein NC130_05585 [Lachnoclostridium sp.]|nr:hypothetical protein [Lachnoclostridium sp.]
MIEDNANLTRLKWLSDGSFMVHDGSRLAQQLPLRYGKTGVIKRSDMLRS